MNRERERVVLSAKIDIARNDGHIVQCFTELLEQVHAAHLKNNDDLATLTHTSRSGSVVRLPDREEPVQEKCVGEDTNKKHPCGC